MQVGVGAIKSLAAQRAPMSMSSILEVCEPFILLTWERWRVCGLPCPSAASPSLPCMPPAAALCFQGAQ